MCYIYRKYGIWYSFEFSSLQILFISLVNNSSGIDINLVLPEDFTTVDRIDFISKQLGILI